MAKKHKKQNHAQLQKLQAAQSRKDFYNKLQRMVTLMTGKSETMKLLSEADFDYLYLSRYHSIRVEAAEGHIVEAAVIKEIKEFSIDLMRINKLKIPGKETEVSVYDFMMLIFSILSELEYFFKNPTPGHAAFAQALLPFLEDSVELTNQSLSECARILETISMANSRLDKNMYWAEMFPGSTYETKGGKYLIIKVYKHAQRHTTVSIKGIPRNVVRVGWGVREGGMRWCARTATSLGLADSGDDKLYPVYIQMHAILRISERLDCLHRWLLNIFTYYSVQNGQILKTRKDEYLIEFYCLTLKLGYLVAILQADKLIVRTFLLLTHDGTPEGAKLQSHTGLQKDDKKYLSLDRLSTFMNPDLRENEKIRQIFQETGCIDLFGIRKDQVMNPEHPNESITSKMILDYMMMQPEIEQE